MLENANWVMLLGQTLGIVAVILGFATYQMKSRKALLIVDMITCGVFCIHYLLIGAVSGFALNAMGMFRNIVYTNRETRIFRSKAWPFIIAGLMLIAGLVSWQDWRSVFMVTALVINSLCFSMRKAQHIRYSLLFTCPLALTYNILVSSYGGIIYEGMVIISAITGIIRSQNTDKATTH